MPNPAATRERRKKAVRYATGKFIALVQAVQQYRKGSEIERLADEFTDAIVDAAEELESTVLSVQ